LKILLRERPDPKPDAKRSGKPFVLLSGLPRFGTSLMMQMLEAGWAKVLIDGECVADVDNLEGYYEWEPMKQIGKDRSYWMRKDWTAFAVSAKIWRAL
jgi:hypothetical protein